MNESALNIKKGQEDLAKDYIMRRLLEKLLAFIRPVPRLNEPMPEYRLEWIAEIDGDGPDKEIMETIKGNPALWFPDIPDDVCLVRKSHLKQLGLSDFAIASLADEGHASVALHAYQYSSSKKDTP